MAHSPQIPSNNDIDLTDIILFLKKYIKIILFFIVIGSIFGSLLALNAKKNFKGFMLISPTIVNGDLLEKTQTKLDKLKMSSFYSPETMFACNPSLLENRSIGYNIFDVVKIPIVQNDTLILFTMSHSNKDKIMNCFNAIEKNIQFHDLPRMENIIEIKKNELQNLQNKLKNLQNLEKKYSGTDKNFKTEIEYMKLYLDLTKEIEEIQHQINPSLNILAHKEIPINIELKSLNLKVGVLIGFFSGLIIGIIVSLIHSVKRIFPY